MDVVAMQQAAATATKTAGVRNAVSLASGDATLTLTQVRGRVVELTGATGTRTVTFPNVAFTCRVVNSTDFDVTLKKSGATGTITLGAGGFLDVSI